MVALTCWLLMPSFVQLDTLSSPSGLGTLKSLPIGLPHISPYGYRRRDFRVWYVHHPVIHEQRLEGEMHLPFMIGRNSCYFIIGWNFGIIRILIGQARIQKFAPIIKCPRFGLGRPLSRGFSVPVHVVSPAPWGCEIKQYSHHLFHIFGRRARV